MSAVATTFRPAAEADLPAVVAIYNAGIEERVATSSTVRATRDEIDRRVRALVAELDTH